MQKQKYHHHLNPKVAYGFLAVCALILLVALSALIVLYVSSLDSSVSVASATADNVVSSTDSAAQARLVPGADRPLMQYVMVWVVALVVWFLALRSTHKRVVSGVLSTWAGTLLFMLSWVIFPLFQLINRVLIPWHADALLLRLDELLWLGKSAPMHLQVWEHATVTEVLAGCYAFFYLLVPVSVLVATIWRKTLVAHQFFTGLIGIYALGFVGYCVLPAGGPYMAFPSQFPYPPQGGIVMQKLAETVAQGITGMDVFPSLHTALTLYINLFVWHVRQHSRWFGYVALLLAPITLGLIVATMYLRYHYGIDVVFGALLAWMMARWVR